MSLELQVSAGKFRVVGVDLFSHEDYLVEECSSREQAFKIAAQYETHWSHGRRLLCL